jgi:hypothetical protein
MQNQYLLFHLTAVTDEQLYEEISVLETSKLEFKLEKYKDTGDHKVE